MMQRQIVDELSIRRPKFRPELLLHPNIPKPLHGVNPRTIKGQGWWDKERRAAYAKMGFCCWACGVHKSEAPGVKWLEGHEHYEVDYTVGRVTIYEIVALCNYCHNYIHDGRMRNMVMAGTMEPHYEEAVLARGQRTLVDNGFTIFKPTYPPVSVPWNHWHLLFEGVEYYSKFKSQKEWEEFYL